MLRRLIHCYRRSIKNKFIVILPIMLMGMTFLFAAGIFAMRKLMFEEIVEKAETQLLNIQKLTQAQQKSENELFFFLQGAGEVLYFHQKNEHGNRQISYPKRNSSSYDSHEGHKRFIHKGPFELHLISFEDQAAVEFISGKEGERIVMAHSLSWLERLLLVQTVLLVIIGFLAIVICSVVILSISYLIAGPICALTSKIENMTDDDEQNGIHVFTERPDEIGFLATKVVAWVDKIKEQAPIIKEQAKMVAVGQTATLLAHDPPPPRLRRTGVRRPFNSVRAILATMDSYRTNPQELKRVTAEVEEHMYQTDHMIADIMDFARTEKLELLPLSLHKMVNFALTHSPRLAEHPDFSFEYQLDHSTLPAVDEMRLSAAA